MTKLRKQLFTEVLWNSMNKLKTSYSLKIYEIQWINWKAAIYGSFTKFIAFLEFTVEQSI